MTLSRNLHRFRITGMGRLRRWLTFNGIGALGMIVQLTTIALLLHGGRAHYLTSTLVGVELAVLHNFAWHQRVTWRDRQASGIGGVMQRLWRFQALNGTVSLAGNVAIMGVLTGWGHLHPLISNGIAVLACSLLNFFGSDALVFRSTVPSRRRWTTAAIVSLTVFGAVPLRASGDDVASELKAGTLAAWRAYEQRMDERLAHASNSGTFFAHDAFGTAGDWRHTALSGAIPMSQLQSASPGTAAPDVPDGRLHHWAGAVFVRGVRVDRLLEIIESRAGRESESYDDVIASKLLSRDGDRLRVFMKLRRTKVITVTYNTEHAVEYRRISATRASGRSVATRIAELTDPGTASEREKPPGSDSGYLWRLNAYWRYEQVADGVLIECESVSLSRSVPFVLRPFISGIVEGVARESLERTLVSLRRTIMQAL
jgi:putative flippase GtrA